MKETDTPNAPRSLTHKGFVVKGKTLCLLALTALFGQPALANEQTPPATDQRTAVLGQPGTGTPNPAPDEKAKKDAQALFEESLRQMMPLDESQIQEYRSRSDERDRALLPVSPTLNTRTVRVTLEPGRSPVAVFTTANIATSLVFHDSTGQPWPITSVTNGGPSFFQVLRPELPEGNLLNVMPIQGYATSTLVPCARRNVRRMRLSCSSLPITARKPACPSPRTSRKRRIPPCWPFLTAFRRNRLHEFAWSRAPMTCLSGATTANTTSEPSTV